MKRRISISSKLKFTLAFILYAINFSFGKNNPLKDAEMNSDGSIPELQLEGTRYYIMRKRLTLAAALEACEHHHWKDRLAVLPDYNSAFELVLKIENITAPYTPEYDQKDGIIEFGVDRRYWIGLVDFYEEGEWLWLKSNGLPLSYDFWLPPQPDHLTPNASKKEHCVCLWNPNYQDPKEFHTFNDESCLNEHYFICEKHSDTKAVKGKSFVGTAVYDIDGDDSKEKLPPGVFMPEDTGRMGMNMSHSVEEEEENDDDDDKDETNGVLDYKGSTDFYEDERMKILADMNVDEARNEEEKEQTTIEPLEETKDNKSTKLSESKVSQTEKQETQTGNSSTAELTPLTHSENSTSNSENEAENVNKEPQTPKHQNLQTQDGGQPQEENKSDVMMESPGSSIDKMQGRSFTGGLLPPPLAEDSADKDEEKSADSKIAPHEDPDPAPAPADIEKQEGLSTAEQLSYNKPDNATSKLKIEADNVNEASHTPKDEIDDNPHAKDDSQPQVSQEGKKVEEGSTEAPETALENTESLKDTQSKSSSTELEHEHSKGGQNESETKPPKKSSAGQNASSHLSKETVDENKENVNDETSTNTDNSENSDNGHSSPLEELNQGEEKETDKSELASVTETTSQTDEKSDVKNTNDNEQSPLGGDREDEKPETGDQSSEAKMEGKGGMELVEGTKDGAIAKDERTETLDEPGNNDKEITAEEGSPRALTEEKGNSEPSSQSDTDSDHEHDPTLGNRKEKERNVTENKLESEIEENHQPAFDEVSTYNNGEMANNTEVAQNDGTFAAPDEGEINIDSTTTELMPFTNSEKEEVVKSDESETKSPEKSQKEENLEEDDLAHEELHQSKKSKDKNKENMDDETLNNEDKTNEKSHQSEKLNSNLSQATASEAITAKTTDEPLERNDEDIMKPGDNNEKKHAELEQTDAGESIDQPSHSHGSQNDDWSTGSRSENYNSEHDSPNENENESFPSEASKLLQDVFPSKKTEINPSDKLESEDAENEDAQNSDYLHDHGQLPDAHQKQEDQFDSEIRESADSKLPTEGSESEKQDNENDTGVQ